MVDRGNAGDDLRQRADRDRLLSTVAPHVWSMYQHIASHRLAVENRLNYFLAIDALLLLAVLSLLREEIRELSILVAVPCLLLVLPILFLLASFFASPVYAPWFELEGQVDGEDGINYGLLNAIEGSSFHMLWLVEMYACIGSTRKYTTRITRLLRICLLCVAVSLAWLLVVFILHARETNISDCGITIVLFIVFVMLACVVAVAWQGCAASDVHRDKRRYLSRLSEWRH